jgi:hypothetical protein
MEVVQYVGIDFWNRPVFKSIDRDLYYGSVDILFDYGASESDVMEKISSDMLLYFGRSLDDDPMGDSCNVKIRWRV